MSFLISVTGSNGAAVPGANVEISASDGSGSTYIRQTGPDGAVLIDNDILTLSGQTVTVSASAPGFEQYHVVANNFPENISLVLPADNTGTALLVGGVAVGALWLLQRKRKRVGAVDFKKVANDIKPFIIPGAVLIGGLLVAGKIFGTGGLFGQSTTDANTDATLKDAIAKGPAATMSDAQIVDYANALNQDLGYSSISNNTTDAMRILQSIGNVTDILKLVQAYGRHWITFFGIPTGTYTLPETVVKQLSTDQLTTLNQYYSDNGINYKF